MPPTQKQNILFICSRNQWRSPTAESIFRKHPDLNVRSAGTSDKARRKVTDTDIGWAHTIFVMESQHRRQLQSKFGDLLTNKKLIILDIPDDYQFMDPELVELLKPTVTQILRLA
jgi:predicted protein tyrosine phosphatase